MTHRPLHHVTRRGLLEVAAIGAAGFVAHPAFAAVGHGHAPSSGGCSLCQALHGGGQAVAAPRAATAPLLRAEPGHSRPLGKASRAGAQILQPDWVMACENEALRLLADHEVVVEGDRIVEVRPARTGGDRIRMPGNFSSPASSRATRTAATAR